MPNSKGGTYQQADVAYKNNTFQGKVEGKKIMSFGATEAAFKVLATAQAGESYDVVIEKTTGRDGKTYNNWINMSKASAGVQGATTVGVSGAVRGAAQTSPRSTYETPEERAKRQQSIVRQSSLGHAVATLSVGAKSVDPAKVIEVAKQYETYVDSAENFSGGATGFDDVPDFDPVFEPK